MKSCLVVLVALVCVGGLLQLTSRAGDTVRAVSQTLPSGWIIRAPIGSVVQTDTMPQGAALSSDGSVLAVVESGFNPPTLRLYDAKTLRETRSIALKGAFGRPLWRGDHVLVAGANADAILQVDTHTGAVRTIALPAKSYPVALAAKGDLIAAATDGDGSVRIGSLENIATAQPIHIGEHPGGLAFSSDGTKVFAAVRSGDYVASIDVAHKTTHRIAAGLHPSDVLTAGSELYVAESDADSVGVYDTNDDHRIADIYVGNGSQADRVFGASPNALASQGGDVFVSLGAANEIAVLREHRLVERLPAGWYPTDVVPAAGRLFVIDGKGEGTRPNVHFDVFSKGYHDYVAAIQYGSIRTVPLSSATIADENPQGTAGWSTAAGNGIVRKGGPIKHVFFILKENRSYDQVLGDMPQGNGDKALNWFGRTVTPNQHALAGRFGLFDNAYANGEVSSAGHNWADAAIANDYVERYWPPSYGGRRDTDDLVVGYGAEVPANGLIWDAARAARVSFRDYGEITPAPGAPTAPTLGNRFDPHYVGWNLDYSDLDRYKEWHREFDAFVRAGTVP
ncbi:MAG TPA: hypothetical protein VGN11_02230, partial [Candidatus Baltobacteraceae bacterium]|nr:hypothetical protein [Candidatus Baltobacteraceae bacterium]